MSKVKLLIYLIILSTFIFLIGLFLIIASNILSYTLVVISLIFGILSLSLTIYLIIVKANVKSKMMSICDYAIFISCSFLIICFVLTFFIQFHSVSGTSMKPTLEDGKYVAVYPLSTQEYSTGDIVVVRLQKNDELLVKRIFASEGDIVTISMVDGNLTITNLTTNVHHPDLSKGEHQKILIEQWANIVGINLDEVGSYPGFITIEKNHFIVIGDNFDVSQDSRYFGQITKSNIFGKILFK
jgi:signal peptidase I